MKTKLALLAFVAAAALAGMAPSSAVQAETLEVGAYPANPPWENKKEDGSFEGFEVDLNGFPTGAARGHDMLLN